MKAYATKAELLSEAKGIKTYKITWVDSNNNENIDIANGIDMRSALATVMRQRKADKIKEVPLFAWMSAYALVITLFSWTLVYGNVSPIAGILGGAGIIVSAYMFTSKYFRYTR